MQKKVKAPVKEAAAAPTRAGSALSGLPVPAAAAAAVLDDRDLVRLTGYNVARANLRMLRAFHTHLGAAQLRPAEFSALVLIASNPGINQKQLGDALDISPPNLAVMLDQMSTRGLLRRVRSSVDRRLQHPQLTRAGEKLLEQANQLAAAMEQQILEVLTSGERAILIELLQKLVA